MAAVVTQDIKSSYTFGKSGEIYLTVRKAASELDAHTAVAASPLAPETWNSLPRREILIETDHFNSANTAKNIFRATVKYYVIIRDASKMVNFDTTGGQQHITQSYNTRKYPAGLPDFQGAINYDGENINGVDIIIPAMTFTEQYTKNLSQVDDAYRNTLATLTGKVNDDTFRGHAAGEVLFKGASGQQVMVDGIQKWQINYTFSVSPNRANFTVGSIPVASKLGWEYLWVLYANSISGNNLIKIPAHVFVERIYDFADFDELDID